MSSPGDFTRDNQRLLAAAEAQAGDVVPPEEAARVVEALERAGCLVDRAEAERGERLDVAYVRSWLDRIAGPGDARQAILDHLVRRFVAPGGGAGE